MTMNYAKASNAVVAVADMYAAMLADLVKENEQKQALLTQLGATLKWQSGVVECAAILVRGDSHGKDMAALLNDLRYALEMKDG